MKQHLSFFLATFLFLIQVNIVAAQTPRMLTQNVFLNRPAETNINGGWPSFITTSQVVAAFNKGRRAEEAQFGFPANSLGIFALPAGYDSFSPSQRGLFLINAERQARAGLDYGGGPVLGKPLEAAELNLSNTAQTQANYLSTLPNLTHASPDGSSMFTRVWGTYAADCTQKMGVGECLFSGPGTYPVEAAIFAWIYYDANADGNRQTVLIQDIGNLQGSVPFKEKGYVDDHGVVGNEGFLGIGVKGNIVVLNVADPSNAADCQFSLVQDPLPVRLISWNGLKEQQTVKLQWQTAWEENSDYFLIQRSVDSKSFDTIGKVASSGTTKQRQSYQWIDRSPALGINYYRLVQTDLDGSTETSRIIAIEGNPESLEQLAIYPNPAASGDVLRLKVSGHMDRNFHLYNLTGRELPVGVSQEDDDEVRIKPAKALQPGLYSLQVVESGKTNVVKLIVK